MEQDTDGVFGDEGALARHIPGYRPRVQQQAMADAVARALAEGSRLVVEAGTGTGKTFAYLAPALRSGRRVIISTGTRNLQDQLFHKDLPLIRAALGVPVTIALLKGRANYLCHERLQRTEAVGRSGDREQSRQLHEIRAWSARTRSGDIAEVDTVREDSPIWPGVTSTAENCLGTECPHYQDCFVVKARRAAQEAEVVVVNHYLLFADLTLREEGFGEVLPGADAIILDEAHQLPHIATQFFGQSVTGRQLLELVRDTRAEYVAIAGELPDVEAAAADLERAAAGLERALSPGPWRAAWTDTFAVGARAAALDVLAGSLAALAEALAPVTERSRGLEQCYRRAEAIRARLILLQGMAPADDDARSEAQPVVRWVEKGNRGFALHATPLDPAPTFRQMVDAQPASWIFTSATLSVNGRFDHFTEAVGIPDADTLALESPFDYARNALLYLPPGLSDPADRTYTEQVMTAALPAMDASDGGVFLLFTSHRALREAADWLASRTQRPLFVQGEQGRGELLARFRAQGDGVLLGTSSFWEGVDVRGAALTLVVIDRLPFSAPGDPVLKARLDALRARGLSPFTAYQLPQAVITLKQGVGRLIRDQDDRGVLMLCDPRLRSRGYGRVFLNSLPPMPVSHRLDDVTAFFAAAETTP